MKELSIEEKAKRYDEAIKKARNIVNSINVGLIGKDSFEAVFPELKESEDERIRKALIYHYQGDGCICTNEYRIDYKDICAWLEKQDEQNLAFIEKGKWYVCVRTSYKPNGKDFIEGKTYYAKEDYKIIGECGEVDIATDNPEEFFRSATEEETNDIIKNFVNEQKPTDKIEPKFKVGDLITNGILVGKIDETHEWGYHAYFGDYYADVPDAENWHKWTIQDAKDGDVLAVEPIEENYQYPFVAIFKERGLDFFNSYCFIGFDGKFYKGENGHSTEKVHPATKEQRDLLFQKMKEAGYEWDAEKKELKEIEQNHAEDSCKNSDDITTEEKDRTEYKKGFECGKQRVLKYPEDFGLCKNTLTAWSEEDEQHIDSLLKRLEGLCRNEFERTRFAINEDENWLKFLKERYTWNPSDEQMKALKEACDKHWEPDGLDPLYTLYQDLKKLREE